MSNEDEERYLVDQVGPLEYSVFDTQKPSDPTVYTLFIVPVKHKWYNYQAILTVYDASAVEGQWPQFQRELYSTFLYADRLAILQLGRQILSCLQSYDVEDPVELSYFFGGVVNNRVPIISGRPNTN